MNDERSRRSTAGSVQETEPSSRSFAEIFQEIVEHISEIVRYEMRLVVLGFREAAAARKRALISLAVAHLLITYGGALVLLGLVYALSTTWPVWLAALVVGAVTGIVGIVVMTVASRKLVEPNRLRFRPWEE